MQKKLSIITVNRNNASGLEKTCLSVITQTFKDFEWIIIDGASEDNSLDIIKQYSNRLNYWISEPDSGIYEAMNKGIRLATGEYLLFLNSGDFLLHPWTLNEVINEIKNSKYADIYYSDTVDNNFQILKYSKNITIDYLLKEAINHQNSLIRRELFSHQLYNENYQIISDWYFFITELLNHNIKFIHINTFIAVYDMHGLSSTKIKQAFAEQKKALRELNLVEQNYKSLLFLVKIFVQIKYLLPYGLYKILQPLYKKIIK